MDITGTLPKSIVDELSKLDVVVSDIRQAGDDIDIIFTINGIQTSFYAVYVGNQKWVIEELEDNANLFPTLEEGDTIGINAVAKLFTSSITSSLLVSFSPLGKIKNKIKDIAGNIKDKAETKAKQVDDWVNDKIDPDQAQEALRNYKSVTYTGYDDRDETMKKMKFNPSQVNVGKIAPLNDQKGQYKVLTGNPPTQDFQVWHLSRNGKTIRVEDLKAQLKAEEAKWVYDNNIPDSWTESDWKTQSEDTAGSEKIDDEDNVTETDNDKQDGDVVLDETEYSVVDDDESNVVTSSAVKEKKPRKKSKYNGRNVTGCAKSDGTVVMASFDENNVFELTPITCSLILSKIEDFQQQLKGLKLEKEPLEFLTKILTALKKLPEKDRNAITKDSNNNVLFLNFGNTDLTTENYIGQFEIFQDRVNAKLIGVKGVSGKDAENMCLQTLNKISQDLQSQ